MKLRIAVSAIFVSLFVYLFYAQLSFIGKSYAQEPISSAVSTPVLTPISTPVSAPISSPSPSPAPTPVPMKLPKITRLSNYYPFQDTVITIFGENFATNPQENKVYLGTERLLMYTDRYIVSADGKQLSFWLDSASWLKLNKYYDLVVETPSGQSNKTRIYLTTPVYLFYTPQSATVGETATIRGWNFGYKTGTINVLNRNGQFVQTISVSSWNNSQIQFTTPILSAGDYYLEITSTYANKNIYRSERINFMIVEPVTVTSLTNTTSSLNLNGEGFGTSKRWIMLKFRNSFVGIIKPSVWTTTNISATIPWYVNYFYKGRGDIEVIIITSNYKMKSAGFISFPR